MFNHIWNGNTITTLGDHIKKITYTLPGKKQINIIGSIVLGLNLGLILVVILYLNNQEFHDFVFNIGR